MRVLIGFTLINRLGVNTHHLVNSTLSSKLYFSSGLQEGKKPGASGVAHPPRPAESKTRSVMLVFFREMGWSKEGYESIGESLWLPVHKDLSWGGYFKAHFWNKLIFCLVGLWVCLKALFIFILVYLLWFKGTYLLYGWMGCVAWGWFFTFPFCVSSIFAQMKESAQLFEDKLISAKEVVWRLISCFLWGVLVWTGVWFLVSVALAGIWYYAQGWVTARFTNTILHQFLAKERTPKESESLLFISYVAFCLFMGLAIVSDILEGGPANEKMKQDLKKKL